MTKLTFVIKNTFFSPSAPPAILKVLAPPTIVRGPQDSEVIEGEGLDMPCEVNKVVIVCTLNTERIFS